MRVASQAICTARKMFRLGRYPNALCAAIRAWQPGSMLLCNIDPGYIEPLGYVVCPILDARGGCS
jgi:hypothetical protein